MYTFYIAANDSTPQWPAFSQPTGPQTSLPATASPELFFSEIISTDIWDLLVTETNNYARHKIQTTPPSRRGILSTWRDTCREEMMAFIGLILTMGIIQLPDIKDYWSTHQTLNLSFFRYVKCINKQQLCYICDHVLQVSDATRSIPADILEPSSV